MHPNAKHMKGPLDFEHELRPNEEKIYKELAEQERRYRRNPSYITAEKLCEGCLPHNDDTKHVEIVSQEGCPCCWFHVLSKTPKSAYVFTLEPDER